MPREPVRREPLTPREENRRSEPAKCASVTDRSLKSSPSEAVGRPTVACVSVETEENNPVLAAHHTARRDDQAGDNSNSVEEDDSQICSQIAEPGVTGAGKNHTDLKEREARLEAREFQLGNQMNVTESESAAAANRADSNEIVLQTRLNDIEIAMEAEVAALKAEYEAALQQMQVEHDAELHEAHLQSAEESMQHIMTKVSRLQAAIAEAAAQVGIKVHWSPPSFPNTDFQEEFEEMGAWLSRLSDTLHELSRERLRLKHRANVQEAHREEVQRRKEVQADLFDLQGPVQVLCRLHTGSHSNCDEASIAEPDCSSDVQTQHAPGHPVHDPATPNRVKVNSNRYNFQTVITESDGIDELFKELEPTVLSVLDGHNVCILSHELAQSSSHTTLRGNDMECGLAAWCAEVFFEAAAADPSLTSARLHVSFLEVTESAVYDIMASNPQGRGSKQDQREPWQEFESRSDNGVGSMASYRSLRTAEHHTHVAHAEAHQQEVEDPEDAADVLQSCFGHRQKYSSASYNDNGKGHTLVCITVTTSNEGLEMVSQLWVAGLSGTAVFAAHDGLEEHLRQPHNALCSLSSLATCLAVRCQGRQNVPWSESPLTRLLKGGLAPGSRLVVLVNLSEATSVSSSTAASLDWVLHLQSLSKARHMSAHTLCPDDSMTIAGNSMAQIPSILSRHNVASSDQELPAVLAATADSMALKVLESHAELENDVAGKDHDKENLIAEMEQLKAQVQDLLGENARLKSQVSELTSKQQLLQADAAFMSEYKINSAIARHSLTTRCSDLEAELSQVRSVLSQREGCVSPSTVSKLSSQDCGHPGGISAASSLALADTTVLMEAGTVSALLQGETVLNAAPAAIQSTATRDGTVATTSAHLCTVGESLDSDPTSEDLDTTASPVIASLGTTLDSSRSSDESQVDRELATQQSEIPDASSKRAEEVVKDISEDSLIKSSSFSLQRSSVPSHAVGSFHDSGLAQVPKVSVHSGRYAKHAARTYSSDSSRVDSDLLAVLSDCPSPSAARADSKKLKGSQTSAAVVPEITALQQGSHARHCYIAPDTVPQEGTEAPRPQVFESLELANFLEASKGPAAETSGVSSTAPVVPPLLTIPAPPPRFPSHKNTAVTGSVPSAGPKPDLARVMDSVDLSSFIRCEQDTPRSINVMDSADLAAFMNAEKECAQGTPARKQRPASVIDSVDLSAFIKGEASGEMVCAVPGDGSKAVSVVDSVDLSNFLKSESSVPAVDFHGRSDQDSVGIDGEQSHGRLQRIEEESETPGIGMSPMSASAHEGGVHKWESSAKNLATPSGTGSQSHTQQDPCDASEQIRIAPPSPAEVPLSSAPESGSINAAPQVNATKCPSHTATPHADDVHHLAEHKNDHAHVTPMNAEAQEQTICLAPIGSAVQDQPQVTPMLGGAIPRNGDAPVDTVATDRLLCDSSADAERDSVAQQHAAVTDGQGWGGIERLDQDLEEETPGDVLSGGPSYSADGSASSSAKRRSSLRLSLGRAGDGIRGLFGSNRRRERGDGSSLDRRWSMSATPRGVTTPRQLMPAAAGRTPRQLIPAGDDGSGGALKTPRSVLGSRASIDKLMRSAFKRSTTLLASARRQGRRAKQPEEPSCVHEQSGDEILHRNTAQKTSGDGGEGRCVPATPKKLDFRTAHPTAASPDVGHSNRSLQSSHHSDVSPVLGFINPATIAETAQDAGFTPRNNSRSKAAALARDKLQQGDRNLQDVAATGAGQEAQSPASPQHDVFSTTVAPTAMPTPRLGSAVCSGQNASVPEVKPASQLPRSPGLNKARGSDAAAASKAPGQLPTCQKATDTAEVADASAPESELPKSPFSRLRALTSKYKAQEQSERAVSSAHTMPIRAMYGQKYLDTSDDYQSDMRAERSETACMNNPHFRELSTRLIVSGHTAPLRSDVPAAALEDDDEVLRGSVSLPFGIRNSQQEDDGNTLMVSHNIAPPNASYAWLVNGPSAPSSLGSQKSFTISNPELPTSICSDHEHHDGASEDGMDCSGRPKTSPLPQPGPSALAHLHSASTSNLHHGLHTAPEGYNGSSAPLTAQPSDINAHDNNPTEVVRLGRDSQDSDMGITPRTRSKGSYWRRGAPLKASHRGTAVHSGATRGSSRGSSPGDVRSVSPPLSAQMQSTIKLRQLLPTSKDQSLYSAASVKAQHSFGRHTALRSAPQTDNTSRRGDSDSLTPTGSKCGKSRADEAGREDKGKEVYMRRMRELDEVTASFKTPAPLLRNSSTLMTPATSQLRKPPVRVSHAQAVQQMTKANADHKRLMAAASASAKRNGKAWM